MSIRHFWRKYPMYRSFLAAAAITAGLAAASLPARAQDASQPVTIVVYTEVAPAKAAEAKKLIAAYATQARKAKGASEVTALQRISDPAHFALVERWQSQADKQAYAATDAVTKYRAALDSLRSAAYDERIHIDQAVGPSKPTDGKSIVGLTHVDVIPTGLEPGTAKVKAFVEAGRAAPGNLRFDDVVQANRKNHFTVIEAWKSQSDKNAWVSGRTARTFREELQPIGGALYDERDFRVVQ
jgi:quinol monooxygenase YgiN